MESVSRWFKNRVMALNYESRITVISDARERGSRPLDNGFTCAKVIYCMRSGQRSQASGPARRVRTGWAVSHEGAADAVAPGEGLAHCRHEPDRAVQGAPEAKVKDQG